MTGIHRGVDRDEIVQSTGWEIQFADTLEQTPPPTDEELRVLRDLHRRTDHAHASS